MFELETPPERTERTERTGRVTRLSTRMSSGVRRGAVVGATCVAVAALLLGPVLAAEAVQKQARAQAGFTSLPAAADGSGVVVAIVDSGVDATSAPLAEAIVDGRDFVDGGAPDDGHGHGTHVAGIVAAAAGSDSPGAAPGASIMPVRVLDDDGQGSDADVADGIRWAAGHGADVINLSLGDSGAADRLRKSGTLATAIREVGDDAVVVLAAGNDAQFERVVRRGVPAIVVVAVDDKGDLADFSNSGGPDAVAAPGVAIRSTVPVQPTTMFPKGTDGWASLSGTSMAAPMVSAEAAVLVQQGLGAGEVRATIAATAHGGGAGTGSGIIDATAAFEAAGGVAALSAASGDDDGSTDGGSADGDDPAADDGSGQPGAESSADPSAADQAIRPWIDRGPAPWAVGLIVLGIVLVVALIAAVISVTTRRD